MTETVKTDHCQHCGNEVPADELLQVHGRHLCQVCYTQQNGRDISTKIARKSRDATQSTATAKLCELRGDPKSAAGHYQQAVVAAADARELQHVPAMPKRSLGEAATGKRNYVEDTLQAPDIAALDASAERTRLVLLSGNDCGALALDASNSIRAENSLEKMLAHQMAATHKAAMEMLNKAMLQTDTTDKVRLMNASMRAMDTYQRAVLTVQRLRTGGQQNIVVQHVQVTDGGQAVIAGAVTGRREQNER